MIDGAGVRGRGEVIVALAAGGSRELDEFDDGTRGVADGSTGVDEGGGATVERSGWAVWEWEMARKRQATAMR